MGSVDPTLSTNSDLDKLKFGGDEQNLRSLCPPLWIRNDFLPFTLGPLVVTTRIYPIRRHECPHDSNLLDTETQTSPRLKFTRYGDTKRPHYSIYRYGDTNVPTTQFTRCGDTNAPRLKFARYGDTNVPCSHLVHLAKGVCTSCTKRHLTVIKQGGRSGQKLLP